MGKTPHFKYSFLLCIAAIIGFGLAAPSTAQVLPDAFDRADNTNIGSDWNEYSSDLEVFGNQLRNTNAGPKAAQFTKLIGPDQDVSVHCKVAGAGNICGVMARWSDGNNFYLARLDVGSGNIALIKVGNGLPAQIGLATRGLAANALYRLRLVASGPYLSVYFGDEDHAAIAVTDSSLVSGNYGGIYGSASAANTIGFDNFNIVVPTGDTFDRADSTAMGSDWNEYLSNLEIFSNQIRNTDSGLKVAQFTQSIGPDQNVSADCKVTAPGNNCGVMARWSSTNNFYMARLDVGAQTVTLSKMVNGVTTQIGSAVVTLTANTYYRIRLVARETSLAVYFAGQTAPVISMTDSTLTAGDYAGILSVANASNTTWFDHFNVMVPYPLNDPFDRANSTNLGNHWDEYSPDLEVFNTQVRNATTGSKAARFLRSIGPNQDIAVDCAVTAVNNSCAVIARWSDANNFYGARLDAGAGNIALFKVVNGVLTQIGPFATRTISYITYYRLRLIVSGASISVFFANEATPAISITDASLSTGNYAGILSVANAVYTTWFNNFNVTPSPAAPSNLTATDKPGDLGTAIDLSWIVSSNTGITEQRVYRGPATGGPYSLVATVANSATSYSDTGLTNGTTYFYVVRAYNGNNESASSNEASLAPIDNLSPAAPTNLNAQDMPADEGRAITLSWTLSTNPNIVQQAIYRGVAAAGPYSQIATVSNSATTYSDTTGLTNGVTYFYVVRADNGTHWSPNSVPDSAVPVDNLAPAAPTNLAISDHSSDDGGSIDLSWTISTSADVTQQRIYRATASGGGYELRAIIPDGVTATFLDDQATANITYYYIVRAYDGTQESDPSVEVSGVSVKNLLVTYTYDGPASENAVGRLIQVDDASGRTQFFYDTMGRIKQTDKTVEETLFRTSSTYDLAGRVDSVTYPDNDVVFYRYAGPFLSHVSKDANAAVNYAVYQGHNALGQPATVTFGNNVTTAYTYSNTVSGDSRCLKDNFRTCKIKTTLGSPSSPTATYQDLFYAYDGHSNGGPGVGNVTRIEDALQTDTSPDPGVKHTNQTQNFTYDDLSRLLTATGPYGAITYSYDQIGNMTCNTYLSSCTASAPNYSYSDAAHRHAVTFVRSSAQGANPVVGTTYAYNANGDMIRRGGDILMYDVQRQLSSVTTAAGTTTFIYDGDGGRVKKIDGPDTIIYIGKLFECRVPCKTGNVWNSTGSKHIFAGSARIAIKPITTTGEINYFHTDHLGSSSAVTDQAGARTAEYAYLPYGDDFTNSGADFRYKYTGQEKDTQTGLYFYNARYYDPRIGRFISPDTIIPNPRNPQDFNRYAYALNNPLKYTDPTGHSSFWKGQLRTAMIAFVVYPVVQSPIGAMNVAGVIQSGGSSKQMLQAAVVGHTSEAVGTAVGFGAGLANPFLGAVSGAAAGGYVNGYGMAYVGGARGRDAHQAGYRSAAIAAATAAVMYGANSLCTGGCLFPTSESVPPSEGDTSAGIQATQTSEAPDFHATCIGGPDCKLYGRTTYIKSLHAYALTLKGSYEGDVFFEGISSVGGDYSLTPKPTPFSLKGTHPSLSPNIAPNTSIHCCFPVPPQYRGQDQVGYIDVLHGSARSRIGGWNTKPSAGVLPPSNWRRDS